MKLHLNQIPAEGRHIEGETECPVADLTAEEILCAGPLRYSLDLGVTAGALWANGTLDQPVTLRCGCCLEPFDYTVHVAAFALHTDLAGPELVDLTPFLREDILLNLPAYPRCDQHGGRVCKAASKSNAEKTEDAQLKRQADWSALDKLKLKKN